MMRPAAPGPRVGGGRVRVDAARAIAKLREYQLVERAAWVLEGIRAAVASNASAITLAGDSNDIWLSWQGEPWPAEDLTRLFDELVSPEAADERHHLRLLAAAVNSGLGLEPAFIDVIAVHDDKAIRARYTPDVLEDPGADIAESALRKMTTETIAVPDGAKRGMRVHLRRRASLEVLSYLFGEPPELAIARGACADIPVLLTIGANRYHRVEHSRDVVRVPLGDGLDGFLAVADPAIITGGLMEVAERGVVLARYPLSRSPDTLPIRLLIDAPRMPTNASRSQVQRDSYPIDAAVHRVPELLPALVAQLVARLAVDQGIARTAALALLAGIVDRGHWFRKGVPEESPLAPLAELPLLRDASGTPRPLHWRWSGLVYHARKPLDRDLEPWVDNILWVAPGDPAERVIAGAFHDQRAVRRRLRTARQQRRDHERFFAHEKRPATVITRKAPRSRMALQTVPAQSCVPQSVFDGLAGEVCIYADDGTSALVVLHHGREIERIEHHSPVRFDAVIDAPAITPGARFRGVLRDAEYARVDRAMRAGVLRAIEAIAHTAPRVMLQHGLVLARSLGAVLGPPLADARAWRSVDGNDLSHAEITRRPSVGIVETDIVATPSAGRLLLRCDREERARLAAAAPELAQVVYTVATAHPAIAEIVASNLSQSTAFALAMTGETHVGAVGPASWRDAVITYQHRGVTISSTPLILPVAPCKIVVDTEAIIPTATWAILGDGIDEHAWQLALVRATALALLGERPLELLGPRTVDLHDGLGRTFCAALTKASAEELLGAELLARVRAHRMWPVLGDPHPQSIDELCARFPTTIPYVAPGSIAIAGFSPLVAGDEIASAVATLAGVPVREASLELEMRRYADLREKRIERHRSQPVQPIALPGDTVEIEGPIARGVVGVGSVGIEVQVLVEGRPFDVIRHDSPLPLRAVVEIEATRTMPAFDGIPSDVTGEIVARVSEAAPALLLAIGAARPHVLGDPGPARRLFARSIGDARLAPLREAAIFLTVQGARTSITSARRPFIATTTWTGTWLARENDPDHPCDSPIIHITDGSGEIGTLLEGLHDDVRDVTSDVMKLQRARRMARGLLPSPTLQGVAPEMKRTLAELGDIGAALGHGEIALVEDEGSSALLHVDGELRKVISIDISPSIQIALEAPELVAQLDREDAPAAIAHQLRALNLDSPEIPHARELALRLTRTILARTPVESLEPRIRRNLVRALFRGALDPADLATVPLFETIAPSSVPPTAIDQQIELFGSVWSVPHGAAVSPPLDDQRIVVRIDPVTLDLARHRGVLFVDATEELALDALARRNRDKPLATTLALPAARDFLAQLILDGDGVTGTRGIVGILHPSAAQRRGIHAHRAMHPFNPIPDTGTWPIVAMLEDARFTPDRTWDRPVDDAIWRQALSTVREACKDAFKDLVKPPDDALALHRMFGHGLGDHRFAHVRGALWIAGPPLTSPSIRVTTARGTHEWVPPGHTGVSGALYLQPTDERTVATLLEDLASLVHGLLVRSLLSRQARERELVIAHVAHALALARIGTHEADRFAFEIARPSPLTAAALVRLFTDSRPVYVVPDNVDAPGIVDNGSLLSQVVLHHVRDRIHQVNALPAPTPKPQHPLQPLLDALRVRFAQLGLDLANMGLVDNAEPMFEYSDHSLLVATRHPHLIKLAGALAANSPNAAAMLDAIAAHGITVLNVALTSVTDAAELRAIGGLLESSAQR